MKKENVNLNFEQLEKIALINDGAKKTNLNVLSVNTGKRTSRSAKDRYIVQNISTKKINYGEYNNPISPELASHIEDEISEYLAEKELFIFEGYAGAGVHTKTVKVITEKASQAMFCDIKLEKKIEGDMLGNHFITVFAAPNLMLDYKSLNINSEAAIIINLIARTVYIAGTGYTCEIKKAIFTIFNYYMPKKNVLPMHCSANCNSDGTNTALFFGLSGTGKTTLSTSENRALIGDDEHIMDGKAVYNIENGCYAKCIGLKKEKEPQIFNAIKKGAMIENVPVVDGVPNFLSEEITENTRAVYPLRNVKNVKQNKAGNLPSVIFFLSADAEGVLPPISRLTSEQAKYYFLSGYTSKLAGTENSITSPKPAFSACFGEPFMPLMPKVYAKLLAKKIKKHNIKVYLINTGWYGGGYESSSRIPLKCTRALVSAAISGELQEFAFTNEPYFGLSIPTEYKEWTSLLNPINTWKSGDEYIAAAQRIKKSIEENYKKY